MCVLTAHAAEPSEREAARVKVNEGRQRYNLGEFGAALEAYKEAYRLLDDPVLLFNIGQCQWKLHDDAAALHSYRSYLRSLPAASNRSQVEARIVEIEKRTSSAAPETGPVEPKPGVDQTALLRAPETETTATPAPATTLVGPSDGNTDAGQRPSLLTRWWFWTAVGVVLAAGVGGVLLFRPKDEHDPICPGGATCGG